MATLILSWLTLRCGGVGELWYLVFSYSVSLSLVRGEKVPLYDYSGVSRLWELGVATRPAPIHTVVILPFAMPSWVCIFIRQFESFLWSFFYAKGGSVGPSPSILAANGSIPGEHVSLV